MLAHVAVVYTTTIGSDVQYIPEQEEITPSDLCVRRLVSVERVLPPPIMYIQEIKYGEKNLQPILHIRDQKEALRCINTITTRLRITNLEIHTTQGYSETGTNTKTGNQIHPAGLFL